MGNQQSSVENSQTIDRATAITEPFQLSSEQLDKLVSYWNEVQQTVSTAHPQRGATQPENLEWREAAWTAHHNSDRALEETTHSWAKLAFLCSMMTPGPSALLLAAVLTPAVFVLDIIKPPFTLMVAGEEKARAKICEYMARNSSPSVDVDAQTRALYSSFLGRLRKTMALLVHLKEESESSLGRILVEDSGCSQQHYIIAIGLLISVWHSRQCNGCVLLDNGNYLVREDCPKAFLPVFDLVVECQSILRPFFPHPSDQETSSALIPLQPTDAKRFIYTWFIPLRRALIAGGDISVLEDMWTRESAKNGEIAPPGEKQAIKETLKLLRKMMLLKIDNKETLLQNFVNDSKNGRPLSQTPAVIQNEVNSVTESDIHS